MFLVPSLIPSFCFLNMQAPKMTVSDDEYAYDSEDEDEDLEDSDDSGNESATTNDSLHPDEVGVVSDSGIEEDGTLEVGYRPRRPPGLIAAGSIRMTTHLGAPGIFDPKSMVAFIRTGPADRYKGLHWKSFQCACHKLTPKARPQGSAGCKLPYYQRYEHRPPVHHRPLTIHQLQLARYSLCQRAFFLLRRSGIKIAEWNFFNKYTWIRIFGNASGYQDESRVFTYLQTCAYTGFLFPFEINMYVPRIALRGMFAFRFEYTASMFEAISHFETIHFGFMKDMVDAKGKPVRWKLDFPNVHEEEFPDLEKEMEEFSMDDIKEKSKYFFHLVPFSYIYFFIYIYI